MAGGDLRLTPPKAELSSWAKDQIDDEFRFYKNTKFTMEDIEKDFKILSNYNPNSFIRFQIIDGKIYSNFDDLDKSSSNIVAAYNTYLDFFTHLAESHDFSYNVDFMVSVETNIKFPEGFIPKVPIIAPVRRDGDPNAKYFILAPDHYIIEEWPGLYRDILNANKKYKWDKKTPRAFWRGGSSGGVYTRSNWQDFPRVKIVALSNEYPALLDAKFTLLSQLNSEIDSQILKKYPIAMAVSQADHGRYKMQISVEGKITSLSSELWRLLSNSVMLRQENTNLKWFHSLFRNGEHYISVKYDMSDLIDKIRWVLLHDEECRKIAENASDTVKREVTPEHLHLYWTQILNKYSTHQSFFLSRPSLEKADIID